MAWCIPFVQELLCVLLMWACAVVVVAFRKRTAMPGPLIPHQESPTTSHAACTSSVPQGLASVDIRALLESSRPGCPHLLALGLFRHHITPVASLGSGGCAQVHLCTIFPSDSSSARFSITAAIKCIPFNDVVSPNGSRLPDLTTPAAAIAEVSANLAVADHPKLFVPLLGYHLHTSGALLAFQPCGTGQTLLTGVCAPLAAAGHTRMPPALLDYYLRFLVASCHVLHTKGLVNLDVKAGNVLLTSALGQPRMADLGSATRIGMLVSNVSTPLYAAPQLAPGSPEVPAHPMHDYWAIAITIIELFYLAANASPAHPRSAHTTARCTASLKAPAPVTPSSATPSFNNISPSHTTNQQPMDSSSSRETCCSVRHILSSLGSSSPDALSATDHQFLMELAPTVAAYQLLRWGRPGALQQRLLADGMEPALVTMLMSLLGNCLVTPVGDTSDTVCDDKSSISSNIGDARLETGSSSSGSVGLVNPLSVNTTWDHTYKAVQTYLAGRGIPLLAAGEEPLPSHVIAALAAALTKPEPEAAPSELDCWAEDDSWWQQEEEEPQAAPAAGALLLRQQQLQQRLKLFSGMQSVPEEGEGVAQSATEGLAAVDAPSTPLGAAGEPWARRSRGSSSGGGIWGASSGSSSSGQDGRSSSKRRLSLMSWGSNRNSRCSHGGVALAPTTFDVSNGGAAADIMVEQEGDEAEEDEEVMLRTPLLRGFDNSSSGSSSGSGSGSPTRTTNPLARLLGAAVSVVAPRKATQQDQISHSNSTSALGGVTGPQRSVADSSRFTTESKEGATSRYHSNSSKDVPCSSGVVLNKHRGNGQVTTAAAADASSNTDCATSSSSSSSSSSSLLDGMVGKDLTNSSTSSLTIITGPCSGAAHPQPSQAAGKAAAGGCWGRRVRKGASKLLRRALRCT